MTGAAQARPAAAFARAGAAAALISGVAAEQRVPGVCPCGGPLVSHVEQRSVAKASMRALQVRGRQGLEQTGATARHDLGPAGHCRRGPVPPQWRQHARICCFLAASPACLVWGPTAVQMGRRIWCGPGALRIFYFRGLLACA